MNSSLTFRPYYWRHPFPPKKISCIWQYVCNERAYLLQLISFSFMLYKMVWTHSIDKECINVHPLNLLFQCNFFTYGMKGKRKIFLRNPLNKTLFNILKSIIVIMVSVENLVKTKINLNTHATFYKFLCTFAFFQRIVFIGCLNEMHFIPHWFCCVPTRCILNGTIFELLSPWQGRSGGRCLNWIGKWEIILETFEWLSFSFKTWCRSLTPSCTNCDCTPF